MKIFRLWVKGLGWLILALLFVSIVAQPTWMTIGERMRIAHAFSHAKAIQLVHYAPGMGDLEDKVVYARKNLQPAEFPKLLGTMPWTPDVGCWGVELMCIFDPHHKMVITEDDGTQTVIRVCFECDHIRVNDGAIVGTPYAWRSKLRTYFANAGMANKSAHEYWHDATDPRPASAPPSAK